jgi:hypothetical protein
MKGRLLDEPAKYLINDLVAGSENSFNRVSNER